MGDLSATDSLYLRDAYLRAFSAKVVAVRDGAVALDRTAFYPTGGGQPHDTGAIGGVERHRRAQGRATRSGTSSTECHRRSATTSRARSTGIGATR